VGCSAGSIGGKGPEKEPNRKGSEGRNRTRREQREKARRE
jgi:hypothetical protein